MYADIKAAWVRALRSGQIVLLAYSAIYIAKQQAMNGSLI